MPNRLNPSTGPAASGGALTSAGYWDARWTCRRTRQTTKRWWRPESAARSSHELLARAIHAMGPQPADILEVGCAPGIVLEYLSRRCPQHRYHGLDYAPQAVEIARQNLKDRNVAIYHGDAATFVPPRQFDLVYS